mgnify:FL=1
MTLNRSFRKSQPVPDLFARQFLDQESDNAFFSFTHFMKDGGDFLRTLSAVLHIPSIPTVFEDRIKLFGFNWLFQKIKGAAFQGTNSGFYVCVPCDNDNRKLNTVRKKFLLQRQPRHAGHTDVQQNASGYEHIVFLKEFFCRKVIHGTPSETFQKKRQACSDTDVVVDDSNEKSLFNTGIDGHIFLFRRTVTFKPP